MTRNKIVEEIESVLGRELLREAQVKDEMANGVQILGKEKVKKIALGVSLNEEFLKLAINWGADFCIFHHGIDTRTEGGIYSIPSQKRLKIIFQNDLTIAGYHYTLDAHPEIGNNAQIIKGWDAEIEESLFDGWGYTAVLKSPKDFHEMAHEAQELFDHDVFVVAGGPEKIRKIGVVSGAAKPYDQYLREMISKEIDLFISGETSESSPHKMLEAGINYFVCGHYATEVFGIKALGNVLKERLKRKVEIEFIDVKNEI